jgi:sugar phosphate isomerase/epimerase
MNQRIFIHLPYAQLLERIDALASEALHPEVYLPVHVLEEISPSSLEATAALLQKNQLECTIHGPFVDLNAGSKDEGIREVTLRRYAQAFAAARILNPLQMVLHCGYDRWHYGDPDEEENWLQQSMRSWEWALEETEDLGLILALENVFEHHPQVFGKLLRRMGADRLRFCFDIGHFNLFSTTPMEEWMEELSGFLAELHLHDNLGEDDDHFAIGEGKIDFAAFFRQLQEKGARPLFTIEAFDERRVRASLNALEKYMRGGQI